MRRILLKKSSQNYLVSTSLIIGLIVVAFLSCAEIVQPKMNGALSTEEIHQIKLLGQNALTKLPEASDWDSLMSDYNHPEEQEALALIYVKRDLLQKIANEELAVKEFEQVIRRYEETCDEIARIIANQNRLNDSSNLYQLLSNQQSLNPGIQGRLLASEAKN